MAVVRSVLAGAALAAVAAGCGINNSTPPGYGTHSVSKSRYVDQVNVALHDMTLALGGLGRARTVDQLQAALGHAQERLRHESDRFAALDPPAKVREEHDELLTGLEKLPVEIQALRIYLAKTKAGSLDSPESVIESLSALHFDGIGLIRDAVWSLEQKGYRVDDTGT